MNELRTPPGLFVLQTSKPNTIFSSSPRYPTSGRLNIQRTSTTVGRNKKAPIAACDTKLSHTVKVVNNAILTIFLHNILVLCMYFHDIKKKSNLKKKIRVCFDFFSQSLKKTNIFSDFPVVL